MHFLAHLLKLTVAAAPFAAASVQKGSEKWTRETVGGTAGAASGEGRRLQSTHLCDPLNGIFCTTLQQCLDACQWAQCSLSDFSEASEEEFDDVLRSDYYCRNGCEAYFDCRIRLDMCLYECSGELGTEWNSYCRGGCSAYFQCPDGAADAAGAAAAPEYHLRSGDKCEDDEHVSEADCLAAGNAATDLNKPAIVVGNWPDAPCNCYIWEERNIQFNRHACGAVDMSLRATQVGQEVCRTSGRARAGAAAGAPALPATQSLRGRGDDVAQ